MKFAHLACIEPRPQATRHDARLWGQKFASTDSVLEMQKTNQEDKPRAIWQSLHLHLNGP
jgi:hypothetical protein